jgi:hypothetical protein
MDGSARGGRVGEGGGWGERGVETGGDGVSRGDRRGVIELGDDAKHRQRASRRIAGARGSRRGASTKVPRHRNRATKSGGRAGLNRGGALAGRCMSASHTSVPSPQWGHVLPSRGSALCAGSDGLVVFCFAGPGSSLASSPWIRRSRWRLDGAHRP